MGSIPVPPAKILTSKEMITNEEIRQACIDGIYEAVGIEMGKFIPALQVAMSGLEHLMTEPELAKDKRYAMLCSLGECLREVNEIITGVKIPQDHPVCKPRPSGLAIESAGDLSGLSREKMAEVCNLMRKRY